MFLKRKYGRSGLKPAAPFLPRRERRGIRARNLVKDYDLVKQLVDHVVAVAPEALTLDLRDLRFLNSLGLYLLMGFILRLRDHTASRVTVRGLVGRHWHERTFGDLKRLMPRLQVLME